MANSDAMRARTWVLLIGVALTARAVYATWPLGADESGLLLIGSQWRPGSSLYGDYWVDRPPLLIDVFTLAHHLGGLPALRMIGALLVVLAIVLAARLARLAGGSPRVAAVVATIFLSTPLFGVHEIDGELIAVPVVLGAIVLALQAARAPTEPRRALLLAAAGAAAAAAVLVKQNEIDGLIVLAIGAVTFLRTGRRPVAVLAPLLAVVAGGLAMTALVLGHAATRGTSPLDVWNAVVTFRFEAARVIAASAPPAVADRLRNVLLAGLGSLAPPLIVLALVHLRRRPRSGALDLRVAVVAVLAWETFSVVGGGSYWLHYLICLVPGLVLASVVITASESPRRRVLRVSLAASTVSAVVSAVIFNLQPVVRGTDPVAAWLRQHATPGQSAVVAFGRANYLVAAGLTSPYTDLWSLPVRVRDPDLRRLGALLETPRRPTWIVTGATGSLSGWGIDGRRTQEVFDANYALVADLPGRRIYRALP